MGTHDELSQRARAGTQRCPARVLLIEDDARVAQSITRVLCREYEVTAVDRASAARALVQSGARFDVLLWDVEIPRLGAVELFHELERLLPEVAARVVFLGAGALSAPVRDCLAAAESVCIDKPFRPDELRSVVAQLVVRATL